MTTFTDAERNSSGMSATSMPHSFVFFYESVAFFFERVIELAHQALQSRFGNKSGITSCGVSDALGVQKKENPVCTWCASSTRKEMTHGEKESEKENSEEEEVTAVA